MNRLLTAVLLSLAVSSAARAQVPAGGLMNIGIAAAVRGAVKAQASGQTAGRVIGSGKPVYLNDHITTGPDSRLQILLLDETTFTLGPNSDMVLDEFVYDPKTSAGKVSAKIASGAFRFVTGKVAQKNPANMKVTLPVGTIGIRGTMVAGRIHGRNAEIILVGPGADNNAQERRGGITVFNERGRTDISASGYGVAIVDGGRPSRGFRFNAVQLNEILNELEPSHTAGNGGPSNAAKNSGDGGAQGAKNSITSADMAGAANALGQTTSIASQQAATPLCPTGVECWREVDTIQSGQANYSATGSLSCSGSGCGSVGTTFFSAVNVNFAGQTLGGGNSSLQIGHSGIGNGTFATSLINSVSYQGLSGSAAYTLTSANLGNNSFAGTALQFLKVNGQPAAQMQVTLSYNNLSTVSASGTSTASRTGGPATTFTPYPLE